MADNSKIPVPPLDGFSLVLGASSGFGAAACLKLAEAGSDIIGVHLDRRSTMPAVEELIKKIRGFGREAWFFNVNACDPEKRAEVIAEVEKKLAARGKGEKVRVLLHSLAFGTLKPLTANEAGEQLTQKQMDMTLDVMAHSLVYWSQDMADRKLLGKNSRIFAMTSSGSTRVIKAYGAVSAAKAALESHIRQLAFELAPLGVTANAIRAGVTDTPALRRIPGGPELHQRAMERNPSGRATTPEDVATAIDILADERLYWMTGNVIGIDGGEEITIS
jgi:NAD(P)-dependent dehydrogenase (short-subunit alcohol dehydrogenase family)